MLNKVFEGLPALLNRARSILNGDAAELRDREQTIENLEQRRVDIDHNLAELRLSFTTIEQNMLRLDKQRQAAGGASKTVFKNQIDAEARRYRDLEGEIGIHIAELDQVNAVLGALRKIKPLEKKVEELVDIDQTMIDVQERVAELSEADQRTQELRNVQFVRSEDATDSESILESLKKKQTSDELSDDAADILNSIRKIDKTDPLTE